MLMSSGRRALVNLYLGLTIASIASATEFIPCVHGAGPLPLEVWVDHCDTLPCRFQRGKDAQAVVLFKTDHPVKTMIPFINVQVGGVWMTFNVNDKNACSSLVEGQCPLNPDDIAAYNSTIPVQKGYPKIRIKIEHGMMDEMRRPVFCYGIFAVVVD